MEISTQDREQEIEKVSEAIRDLQTIFKELAVLIIDQGSIIDRIDYNMEKTAEQTQQVFLCICVCMRICIHNIYMCMSSIQIQTNLSIGSTVFQVHACMRACVLACVRACVRVCVCAFVLAYVHTCVRA